MRIPLPPAGTAIATLSLLCLAAAPAPQANPKAPNGRHYLSQPLVTSIYTADPSAHVFGGRIYVYPSHDVPTATPDDDLGSEYAMHDYRILSMDRVGGPVSISPPALDVKDVAWASKQMWAPDAAYIGGHYLLYFPARDRDGVFRIGVATGASPTGPFKADPEPMHGSFSIDPAVFADSDGSHYMYYGGIWGGQLENWADGRYTPGSVTDLHQDDKPALSPKVVRLSADGHQMAEKPRDVVILDEQGKPLLGGDHDRRFFEASWMFKRDGVYYFTYSTGDTHFLAYATGTTPYGPFHYRGDFLLPVQGWTTHHSIVEIKDRWYLFYADTQLSNRNSLRSVKMTPLQFGPDGSIKTIDPFTD